MCMRGVGEEGTGGPKLVTILRCQLRPAAVSSFYSQQPLPSLLLSPSVGAPAQDKSRGRPSSLPSSLSGATSPLLLPF